MSRLEKKCFVASAGAHGVLFVLLFVWPLLFVSKKAVELTLPELTFIPLNATITDGPTLGGGNSNAKAPASPPAARPLPPQALVAPPVPKPLTSPAREEPKPVREEPEPTPKAQKRTVENSAADKATPKSKADESDDSGDIKIGKRNRIKVTLNRESGASSHKSSSDPRADAASAARAAQAQYAARINQIVGAIGQGVSSGTTIDVPGPGGAAFINYAQLVEAAYKRAWSPPATLSDDSASVEATVVILRSGKVESFNVTRPSGHSSLDKSVERLVRIPSIAPFPEGTTDEKRTFILVFDLKSKRPF